MSNEYKTIEISVFNPFKGSSVVRTINISEVVENEKFECLKQHIADHLKHGLSDAKKIEGWNEYEITQLEFLIVQLYQPSDMMQLINKLMKFQSVLYKLQQFQDVMNYLKSGQ